MAWNGEDVAIDPRAIDNASPGIGLNINPDAADYDGGDVVTLAGNYVAPKRIVDDPEYLTYAPAMVAYLLTLPWCMLETETSSRRLRRSEAPSPSHRMWGPANMWCCWASPRAPACWPSISR